MQFNLNIPSINGSFINISILSILIGGLISLIISTFGCKLNYIGTIIGYVFISVAILSIIMMLAINKQIISILPFTILIGSILGLLIIIGTNKNINKYTVSMEYYTNCIYALFILLVIFFLFFNEIKNDYTNKLSIGLTYVLIILSFCFMGYVVIIKNILYNSTTDEKNTCSLT